MTVDEMVRVYEERIAHLEAWLPYYNNVNYAIMDGARLEAYKEIVKELKDAKQEN